MVAFAVTWTERLGLTGTSIKVLVQRKATVAADDRIRAATGGNVASKGGTVKIVVMMNNRSTTPTRSRVRISNDELCA